MKEENVLCIAKDDLNIHFDMTKSIWKTSVVDINRLSPHFIQRVNAETNSSYKQLIPYALFINSSGEILTYQRHGSEKRLSGIHSIGFGGHVNDKDEGILVYEYLTNGLIREIKEEMGITVLRCDLELLGMINEDETEVGHCHIGVVFKIQPSNSAMVFDSEIGNAQWIKISDINHSQFELWSQLAIKLIKNQ